MTARAGSLIDGLIPFFNSSARRGNHSGAVIVTSTTIGSAPPVYKNKGWYVAGSVFEVWITTPLPGTNFNPATGHFLTDVDYVVLEQ